MTQKEIHQRALNNFVNSVKSDPNVIALLLNGSLAYGTVWAKSDIDLLMLIRDGADSITDCCVDEDGIYISLSLMEVSKFKGDMQKWRGDNMRSQYALGTIVLTKDEELRAFIEGASRLGKDDALLTFLALFNDLWTEMTRAEKWITVFDDPLYAQRFLQWCAAIVADMELVRHLELPNRESILRARQLSPDLMRELHVLPSTTAMTKADVRRTLEVLDDYLAAHMDWWKGPILKFLAGGEVKTASHIAKYLRIGYYPLDYLAGKGIIEKVTQPTRLFKYSKLTVEEAAYLFIGEGRAHA